MTNDDIKKEVELKMKAYLYHKTLKDIELLHSTPLDQDVSVLSMQQKAAAFLRNVGADKLFSAVVTDDVVRLTFK